ncbi:MAG: hypothetical protein AAF559_02115 [Pseudomonadota bacterium]
MRIVLYPAVCLVAASLVTCAPEPEAAPAPIVNEMDPYLARALNDPLMVDPDLAYRNEANAAITIGYDHALPSFRRSEEAASLARETARLELLEKGPIPDLPLPETSAGPASLAEQYSVDDVLKAVKAPTECRREIRGGFGYAANMPDIAQIMPHGMVRVAAGVDQPGCMLRLVRYVTPADIDDAVLYHYTLATRAGMEAQVFGGEEPSLAADRRGVSLKVFARKSTGDLTAIDLVTWSR